MALLNSRTELRGRAHVGRRLLLWVVLGLASGLTLGAAPVPPAPEYQVKAVFLFNFAQFVKWPTREFPTASSPIVIGILGEDPFGRYLDDDVVKGEIIDGHPIAVKRYRSADEARECHILFIARSETPRLEKILLALRNDAILTVSDINDFSKLGGMIRFVIENGKPRLWINNDEAKASAVQISSKVLRSATIVTGIRR